MKNSFLYKLSNKWKEDKFVCVGLDSDYSKIPSKFKNIFQFNKWVIDQLSDLICCYKINSAFYEAEGVEGLKSLKETVSYIHQKYSDIPVILDAKKGDIGNTNEGYVKAVFDDLEADAVTVHPYLGKESLQPFLERKDKGIFVLVKTSNPGASEFQDLKVSDNVHTLQEVNDVTVNDYRPLYQVIATKIAKDWNKNGNLGVVVGATYSKELKKVREIIGDLPILIPGMGIQGGDLKATIKAGRDSQGQGMIINSSRGIIFAKDPRDATLKLHQEILSCFKTL